MRIIDGAKLFEKLEEKGLTDKTVRDFSLDDLSKLAEILSEHVDGTAPPFKDELGRLIIPFNAPAKYRYWLQKLTDQEKYDLFLEMGCSKEEIYKYMHQRSINIAEGVCDKMGRKKE